MPRMKCAYGEKLETAIKTLHDVKELLNSEIYESLKQSMPDNNSLLKLSTKLMFANTHLDKALEALGGINKIDLQF